MSFDAYRKAGMVYDKMVETKEDESLLVSKSEKNNAEDCAFFYNAFAILAFLATGGVAVGATVTAGSILPFLIACAFLFTLTVLCMIRRRYWRRIAALGIVVKDK